MLSIISYWNGIMHGVTKMFVIIICIPLSMSIMRFKHF
jgi:hypothetical protein